MQAKYSSPRKDDDVVSRQSIDVRTTLLRAVPFWVQSALTAFTGSAFPGARPLYRSAWWTHLAGAWSRVAVGVGGAAFLLQNPPAPLPHTGGSGVALLGLVEWLLWILGLLWSWILVVGGERRSLTDIAHQCVHGVFTGNREVDQAIGEISTAMFLQQNLTAYRNDHIGLHHSASLATLQDPDLRFIRALGFRPGMSKRALWRHFWKTLASWRLHGSFLRARLLTNFVQAGIKRRSLSWVIHGLVLVTVVTHGWVSYYLVGWLFPSTLLYHCAALCQFLTEHRWERRRLPGEPRKIHLVRLTYARLVGEAAPSTPAGWFQWAMRAVFVYYPYREAIACGTLPAHDWHHRFPASLEWPDAIYARQRDIDNGYPGWPEGYHAVWGGLWDALDAFFEFYSALPTAIRPRGLEDSTLMNM